MTTAFDNLIAGLDLNVGSVAAPSNAQAITPVDLALPLFDFQQEAVAHALRDSITQPYAYVGLDMGLGKTPVGISVAAALSAAGVKPTLISVPPSLRINWQREVRKFAPWLKVATITGSKPVEGDILPDVDVLIIGDAGLAGWADYLTGRIGGLVVDEAHRFKNASKRAEALAQLASGVKLMEPSYKGGQRKRVTLTNVLPQVRVLMSGTPTPNGRHQELASQVDIMGDGAWKDIGGKGTFWNHYAPKVDRFGSRANHDGASLFKAMSGSWFFRRLRDDVLEMPNKGRTPVALECSGKYVKEYKHAEQDLIDYLAGKQDGKVSDGQRRSEALLKLGYLRRLAGYAKVQAVADHVKDILDSEPGGVFVVAENKQVIDDLMLKLSKYNPTTVRGGQSDTTKQAEIDDFVSGKSRVLIGQVTAAGVGLTLHGNGLNHRVVVAQLPWTPADLLQAEDRLHRIGQTHDVMVEVGISTIDGTLSIDERLWGMLEAKYFNSKTITEGEGEYLLDEVQEGLLDSYR